MALTKSAYSIDEFCEDNGLGRTRVYEEISSGRLRTLKVGRRRLITAEAATAWRQLVEAESQPPGSAHAPVPAEAAP